jgi:thiazole synthase ThiGH ThiG subunit
MDQLQATTMTTATIVTTTAIAQAGAQTAIQGANYVAATATQINQVAQNVPFSQVASASSAVIDLEMLRHVDSETARRIVEETRKLMNIKV